MQRYVTTRWAALLLVCSLAAGAAHASGAAAPAGHSHAPATAGAAAGQAPASAALDAHTREDIERHQGMARAHAQAAQCLQVGTPAGDCQKQLQAACKGLALGKNCGMRHAH